MNHNVKVTLWWSLLENFSSSIRSGDVLSAYLFLVTKSNRLIGYIQGVNGILQMVAALPAGVFTDRLRRDTMLRVSALVGLLSGLFLSYTLLWAPTLLNFYVAMALQGAYRGINNPPLESIFADSVARGRSSLYTLKYVVTVMSSGAGPLLSLALFLWLGDTWQAGDCRHVLLWGLGAMVPSLVLMCMFDDSKALGHRSDARLPSTASAAKLQSDGEEGAAGSGASSARGCCSAWQLSPGMAVTLLVSFSDLIGALASGMTLKFFSMFFMQVCGVSPSTLSLLGALSPLGISLASLVSQRTSQTLGRVQISLLTRLADVVLLVCMARLPTSSPGAVQLLMGVHLLRMALANCTRPLMRSVLMEFVEKRHRGKVNAVDSVRTFSWSGSAALGGILIERYGFANTFLITAGVKTLAWVPLLLLLRYVHDGPLAGGSAEDAGYSMLPENAAAAEEQEAAQHEQQASGSGGGGQLQRGPVSGEGEFQPLLEPLLEEGSSEELGRGGGSEAQIPAAAGQGSE